MAARERPVTQSDVAKVAGVSRGLVSQALSDDGRMTPPTRTHIREIAERLGYYPHSATAAYCHGLTLGTDLGIVGYGDIDLARRPGFELSSINQNPHKLAQATVSSALSAPFHEPTTLSTVPRLIVRQSSTRLDS